MRPFLISLLLFAFTAAADAQLLEYVKKPDRSFKIVKLRDHKTKLGVHVVELRMISQTWKGIPWKHKLFLAYPKAVGKVRQGILVVSGGGWNPALDEDPNAEAKLPKEFDIIARICATARMPVGLVTHVPFQPILGGRKEDAAIAYTYDKYLRTGDAEWPLLFPMAKSVVRAMDAFQKTAKKEWKLNIKNFVVTGASKRGWTTWLTAAADKRVNGIAPMVIDTLNMAAQMKHQLAAYGKFSEQIKDYTELKIQERMDTPRGRKLNAMVDPLSYRDRLTMPKMIINGTNDPYWVVDSLNLYWDRLKGEKWVMYVPNAGHNLNNDYVRIISNVVALAKKVSGQLEFPKQSWTFEETTDGVDLSITTDGEPTHAYFRTAESDSYDFRNSKWTTHEAEKVGSKYVYHLPRPETGYAAVHGEVRYNLDGNMLFLCTQMGVIHSEAVTATETGTK